MFADSIYTYRCSLKCTSKSVDSTVEVEIHLGTKAFERCIPVHFTLVLVFSQSANINKMLAGSAEGENKMHITALPLTEMQIIASLRFWYLSVLISEWEFQVLKCIRILNIRVVSRSYREFSWCSVYFSWRLAQLSLSPSQPSQCAKAYIQQGHEQISPNTETGNFRSIHSQIRNGTS